MQTYTLKIVDDAKRDLIEIEDYIQLDSPQNAAEVIESIENTIDSLSTFPYRFGIDSVFMRQTVTRRKPFERPRSIRSSFSIAWWEQQ